MIPKTVVFGDEYRFDDVRRYFGHRNPFMGDFHLSILLCPLLLSILHKSGRYGLNLFEIGDIRRDKIATDIDRPLK